MHEFQDDIHEVSFRSYPETLKNMYRPPTRLFARGRLSFPCEPKRKYLCVVGSREPSPYGEACVKRIISGLKGYPISIVSGLAVGIDGMAHTAALDAGLHCIAFPGSSLDWDELYPPEHLGLAERIVRESGTLFSEYAPESPLGKWAFIARNRLMAGISHATLIIEAGKGSGSLKTAKYAEDYDRDVMAVPGPIDAPLTYGTHMLIQRGAALVSSSSDVLRELGFIPKRSRPAPLPLEHALPDHVKSDSMSMKIMEHAAWGSVSMDELIEKVGIPVSALNEKLTFLELEGFLKIDGTVVRRASGE